MLVALLLALSLAACEASPAAGPPSPSPTTRATLDRLRDQVRTVADTQRAADARLAEALDAVRRMDGYVAELRSPDEVDAAVDRWPAVDAAFTSVDETSLRRGLLELARHIDAARATLAEVEGELSGAERRYLEAEDEVLVALRSYAEVADRLAQTVERMWPVYAELHGRAADFVERRWFYRSEQEAADAFELEVQPLLDDLAGAQAAIADARAARDDAAEVVNEATAEAADAWEARRDDDPSPR